MAFSLQDPRLGMITDPEVRKKLERTAMFKGLGDLGFGLLQQSGFRAGAAPTLGEAVGNAAPKFFDGVDDSLTQGLLVDKERREAIAEAKRQARLKELQGDAVDPSGAEFGLLTDNEGLVTQSFKKPEKKGGSGGSITALQNLLEKQAGSLFGDVDPVTGNISVLANDRPKVRAIATRAGQLIKAGRANEANAVTMAARELNIDVPDLSVKNDNGVAVDVDPLGIR